MSETRTFLAATVRDAMQQVRRELGPDAILLETRRRPRKGVVGAVADAIEITATVPPGRGAGDTVIDGDVIRRPTLPKAPGAAKKSADVTQGAPDLSLREQLQELRDFVVQIARDRDGVDDGWRQIRAHLAALELPGDWIDDLCRSIRRSGFTGESGATEQVLARMVSWMAERIPIASAGPREREVIALVGTPGAGITTTALKLAALFKWREGRSVALISLDRRVGAIQVVREWARVLAVPTAFAENRGQVETALTTFGDREVLLIDTPGSTWGESSEWDQVKAVLPTNAVVHFVADLSLRDSFLRIALERFAAFGYQRLILTKLDATTGPGAIATASGAGVGIRYVGVGPRGVDHLWPANGTKLAEIALGVTNVKDWTRVMAS